MTVSASVSGTTASPPPVSNGGYISVQEAVLSFTFTEKTEKKLSTSHLISW
jgi:hypothetical protein